MKKIVNEKLSIAIPTYNEEHDLEVCLNAIASQNYPKKLIEVLIIDNYSSDKTIEVAKSFSGKINIKILKNKIKDAEVSKMIGFNSADGEFFMYLDADMKFSDNQFIKKMLFPFKDNKGIVGNFVGFKVNKSHPSLTRTLSYDEFQRDPIFKFFTIGIKDILVKKNKNYWLCECSKEEVPPQGLMIYRRELILDYAKTQKQLIDNEIPAVLVEMGFSYFAFIPDTGVEHLLLRNLKELWKKRIRNLQRTYYPNVIQRKFKWINWKKDWIKIGIWLIYTHFFIFPIANAVYKSFKYRDICFLNEPMLNLVSTYSIIYGVISNTLNK
ncbi:MAG TPA: glycosyltransferase family 2 protein [Candidatus Nanoarchaeia archaeon]|nr:glycosyltransferase family 2 protein [Candidatus Nanoarchaeia archaeon]